MTLALTLGPAVLRLYYAHSELMNLSACNVLSCTFHYIFPS